MYHQRDEAKATSPPSHQSPPTKTPLNSKLALLSNSPSSNNDHPVLSSRKACNTPLRIFSSEKNTPNQQHPQRKVNFQSLSSKSPPSKELDLKKARAQALMESPKSPRKRNEAIMISPRLRSEPMMGCESWEVVSKQDLSQRESIAAERFLRYLQNNQAISMEHARLAFSRVNTDVLLSEDETSSIKFIRLEELEKLLKDLPPQDEKQYILEWLNDLPGQEDVQKITKNGMEHVLAETQDQKSGTPTIESLNHQMENFKNVFTQVSEKIFKKWILSNRLETIVSHLMLAYKEMKDQIFSYRPEILVQYSIEELVKMEVEKQLSMKTLSNNSMVHNHDTSQLKKDYERLNHKIDACIKDLVSKNDQALELMMDRILQDSEEQFSFLTSSIGNLQKDILKLQHQNIASTLPISLPSLSSENLKSDSKEGRLIAEDLIKMKHAFETKLKEISGNMFGQLESTSNFLERCNNIEKTVDKKFREFKSKSEKEISGVNDRIDSMKALISENDSKYLKAIGSQSWSETQTNPQHQFSFETKLEETKKYFAHQILQLSQNIDHLLKNQDDSEKSMQTIAKSNIQLTQDIHLLHTENYKSRELQEINEEKISKIEIEIESLRNVLDKTLHEGNSSKDVMKNFEHDLESHRDTMTKLQSSIEIASEKLSSVQQEIKTVTNHQESLECAVDNLRQDLVSNTKDLQQHLKYQLDTNKYIETALMNLENVRNENRNSIQNIEIKFTERDSLVACIQKDLEIMRENAFNFNQSLLSFKEDCKNDIEQMTANTDDITKSITEIKSFFTEELNQIRQKLEEHHNESNQSFQEKEDKISEIQTTILEMKLDHENTFSCHSTKLEMLTSLKEDISSVIQRQQLFETEIRQLAETLSTQMNQLQTHHKTIIQPSLQEYRLTFDTLGIWRAGIEETIVLLKKKSQEMQNGHDQIESEMHSLEKMVKDLDKKYTSQLNDMIKQELNDLEKRMNELNTIVTSNGLKLDQYALTCKKDIDTLSKSSSTIIDALHHSERGLLDKLSVTSQHIESIQNWKSNIDILTQNLQREVDKEKVATEQFSQDMAKLQAWKQETDDSLSLSRQQIMDLQSSKEQLENSLQEKLNISEQKQITIINVAHEEFIRIESKLNEALESISTLQTNTNNLEESMLDRIGIVDAKAESLLNEWKETKQTIDDAIKNVELEISEKITTLHSTFESKLEKSNIDLLTASESIVTNALEHVNTRIAHLQEWNTKLEESTAQRISSIHETMLQTHQSTLENYLHSTVSQQVDSFNTWKVNAEQKMADLSHYVHDRKEHDDRMDKTVESLKTMILNMETLNGTSGVQEKIMNMVQNQVASIHDKFDEKFSIHETSIQELRDATEQMRNQFTSMSQTVSNVELSLKQQLLTMLENANLTCVTRVNTMEQTLQKRVETLSTSIDQRMDQHLRNTEAKLNISSTSFQELEKMTQQLFQLDHQLQQLTQHVATLESQKIKELDDNIVDIYKKIVKLYGQMDMQGELSKLMENIIGIQAVLSESHRNIRDMCDRSLHHMETHAVELVTDFCNMIDKKREAAYLATFSTLPLTGASGVSNQSTTFQSMSGETVSDRSASVQNSSSGEAIPLHHDDQDDVDAEYSSMMQQILLLQSMAQNLSSPQQQTNKP
ncbi:hypothetical protein C9374_011125 [Naegleria lovaniensis]|uniref:Uncharacterized protein n=1 Tax=Naegleria lovaniensis TaxID=51637 RepID=A0AA88KFG3_NAELO|nr:uncharacterized protein C9374_011125 [Naegleria lovaniensis]KAG2374046.1 hypothetical protein C9374_011125 [Naegleria lovaniensis]